ncbi:Gamma-glutamyl phosphate reductase [Candidatus Syntrophocurvum alkaliphilum]|uniref:Gamma-glutamyl phosphate reductase n=1 Tax=Candidatus Syntrophocurvum alkaliphilum TaxID=2293317 RepID=A0A6I6DCT0_9FIRM|nr:glutamate-5-semialdehyde dehydrogenase [Candidatus Syntrophocurvum alkaliphilum]QGU00030.1 Gamma-glutamyl phosphate reductase [Candidatus Syntrophocurvum alkaliphilum]
MDVNQMLIEQGKKAKSASRNLATMSTNQKNNALLYMADKLEEKSEAIIVANEKDLKAGKEMGLTSALLDRLALNEQRIKDMADGLREIVALPDPVGEVIGITRRPNGLEVGRVRVPIGVIGIIYESRPNVTADAAGLCLKAGNAIILRGGEEALNSNRIITQIISDAALESGIPEGAIQLIDSLDREAAVLLMKMHEYVDVLIPRGGIGLKKAVLENAKVPIIMTGMGNCHVYADEYANIEKARNIAYNAKVQRPSVCNAAEKLLVHEKIAQEYLPTIVNDLRKANVTLKGCNLTQKIVSDVMPTTEDDWHEEYLELTIAIKVVKSLNEAINHINTYGTGHSEAIVSENYSNVRTFMAGVDAAAVFANASTRFTDGNIFGFGAEMGISTQKLHARGPMGLQELTTNKFIIYGDGHVR